jgi:hypothetical protein
MAPVLEGKSIGLDQKTVLKGELQQAGYGKKSSCVSLVKPCYNKTSDLEMKHHFSRTGFRVLAIKHLTLARWATTTHIIELQSKHEKVRGLSSFCLAYFS